MARAFEGAVKMKNPVLDLTREVCHACGDPLAKNLRTGKEWCINKGCLIRNIQFTIPYKEPEDEHK